MSDLEIDLQLNSVCDAFESAWQAGQRPQLAEFLADTRLPVSTLFVELVQIEMEYRRRTGEQVTLEEYVVRYPEFRGALSELAPSFETVSMPAGREAPPATLGRFELVAPLGEGTFGVVWKARDTKLRRWVAIKRFRESPFAPDRDLFAREARAVQKLDHPNVVRLLELSQGATTDYIVFEYVEGRTLKAILEERNRAPLDPDRAARIALQVAGGLQHIHERGLIHRDLKPANVMITPAGDAKILDFGLARHVDTTSTIGGGEGWLGTILYMSPEQLQKGKGVTHQSDIYALGAVLYEMLAGRRPFDGPLEDLVTRIPKGDPARFEAPAALQTIVRRAMEIDPFNRYPSAAAMGDDLQRHLSGIALARQVSQKLKKVGRRVTRRDFLVRSTIGIGATAGALSVLIRSPEDGRHDIVLNTEPQGAEVHVAPIHPNTGEPDPTLMHRVPGRSPVRARLLPGTYLVIAHIPETGRFHEVFRKVPGRSGEPIGVGEHQRWELRDGIVYWPSIKIPELVIVDTMTLFSGDERFVTGEDGNNRRRPALRSIPPFYLDRNEITVAEYQRFLRGDRPHQLPAWKSQLIDQSAAPLNWDTAVLLAEIIGKRLMNEFEYEFAATNGGERDWSWGNTPSPPFDIGTDFQIVGIPDEDHVGDPPVYGLCSGLAEWTSSGPAEAESQIRRMPLEPLLNPRQSEYRVIRGGTLNVLLEREIAASDRDPRQRLLRASYTYERGLGLRCARSVRPRVRPQDFVRLTADDQLSTSSH